MLKKTYFYEINEVFCMNRVMFTGIMPALVSPLNEDGSIREAVLRKLVADLSETGITGFYILGATGEGVTIAPERRMEFAEIVKDAAPANMKIINHIAATDLGTVRKLARHSREIGMDGIASVPPFFFQYDEAGVIEFYRNMSDYSEGLPLLMYASPMSGPLLPISAVEKMLDIPGFVGMKFTNPNYYLMSRYKAIDGGNINIINGPDETCSLGLLMGADGAIGSTYNYMPRTFVKIYNLIKENKVQEAIALQHKANKLIIELHKYQGIAPTKAAVEMKGYDVGDTSRPLPRMTAAEKETYWAALRSHGFPEEY